jgi:hypothetical protein
MYQFRRSRFDRPGPGSPNLFQRFFSKKFRAIPGGIALRHKEANWMNRFLLPGYNYNYK